jgi:hypothetical protein
LLLIHNLTSSLSRVAYGLVGRIPLCAPTTATFSTDTSMARERSHSDQAIRTRGSSGTDWYAPLMSQNSKFIICCCCCCCYCCC